MTKVTISSSDSWMSQNHRGSGNEPQKSADPWLYVGNGMYMKYTQFIERRKNKNAS